MCGIVGYFGEALGRTIDLERLTKILDHRGPDGSAFWTSQDQSVGLGQTRLAVIDIPGGAQPMHSVDGAYAITFNGEIYNYKTLRDSLLARGHRFQSHSDTEVILEAYRLWGRDCIHHLEGMFAFTLYDKKADELFIARDRTGIKPLYYYSSPAGLIFASEIKAILSVRQVPRKLNYDALVDFMVLGYPVAPKTMFEGIQELSPGSYLVVKADSVTLESYWVWSRESSDIGKAETLEQCREVLIRSVESHLVSDVPVAAFLSGGIDSSLLSAIITKDLDRSIDTFHVSFGDYSYDESEHARLVAKSLSTDHHEIKIDTDAFNKELAETVIDQFDQPFADSSAIPTYLISKEIRKHVKVALAGDGGDEMFGGYTRFRHADVAKMIGRLPLPSKAQIRGSLDLLKMFSGSAARKLRRLLFAACENDDRRLIALSCYSWPEDLAQEMSGGIVSRISEYAEHFAPYQTCHDPSGLNFIDATIDVALAGDYLRKVDVSSSAHGLEVREPFLGSEVIDFAGKLPRSALFTPFQGKVLLRRLAHIYLPKEIAYKPKGGFGIPLDTWLSKQSKTEIKRELMEPGRGLHDLISLNYLRPLLDAFVSGQWDHAQHSRYMVYQRVYMVWSLDRWIEKWQPTF